ncbi:glycoside hydrolase family 105 protein [Wenyingzhuangia sp. 2_MG-2023]|nr:glycoside hydrolase family 88 protein [Wenyingzhuangia sp. 2_MG-2023]MDO6738721.1 glycoside hydrolase family 88 protein [Wenyingzhuangia sp. 2_MG-2023]MDO6803016.1 glycoside hydrolase family 88 protein [Wenyingzhuangia sp. 1_MG-2023]
MKKSKFIWLLPLGVIVLFSTIAFKKKSNSQKVKAITEKVANWQIRTFDDMGMYRALPSKNRKSWHHRNTYHDLEWHCAAFYSGLLEYASISDSPLKYINWLKDIGNKNKWRLFNRVYHADDQAVGQFYLDLYGIYKQENMLLPTQTRFDSILHTERAQKIQWYWSDALFMAPPVWTKLSKVTQDSKYLDFMDKQYHKTYNMLWDKEEKLFFRDKSYFNVREKNGEKIFWARGNGWVFGGLALMIPDFPNDWSGKDFYLTVFKDIAKTLKERQRTDGTWSASLLGSESDFPNMETSGTAFFTFGLAWGINNGVLDAKEYEDVMLKSWNALVSCVNENGMLGYVQPVGAAPGESFKDYTELYGSGAFLAAGTEVYKYYKNLE